MGVCGVANIFRRCCGEYNPSLWICGDHKSCGVRCFCVLTCGVRLIEIICDFLSDPFQPLNLALISFITG